MCRMSSKEKLNVQDQSKERSVSGSLKLSEEKESSPGKSVCMSESSGLLQKMLVLFVYLFFPPLQHLPRELHCVQSGFGQRCHVYSQSC